MQQVSFRLLSRADFPLLRAWLQTAHVKRWWNHQSTPEALEADFGPSIDGADKAELFVASRAGSPFGFVQRYTYGDNPGYMEELAPIIAAPPEALSIDYFVGATALLRQGLGAAMIRAALAQLWPAYPRAPAVIVPVNAANTASWRVLERAGFTRVAQGPLAPDNPVDDPHHYVYAIARPGALE
jgi:aminoglycoside 6'-N-acetyltransferase